MPFTVTIRSFKKLQLSRCSMILFFKDAVYFLDLSASSFTPPPHYLSVSSLFVISISPPKLVATPCAFCSYS